MVQASTTIRMFGLYMNLVGLLLILVPNLLLGLFGIPATPRVPTITPRAVGRDSPQPHTPRLGVFVETLQEVWIRVVGLFAAIVGIYYHQAAAHNLRPFFPVSVYGRLAFALGLTVLALLGLGHPMLIEFALVDALGALWTGWALKG